MHPLLVFAIACTNTAKHNELNEQNPTLFLNPQNMSHAIAALSCFSPVTSSASRKPQRGKGKAEKKQSRNIGGNGNGNGNSSNVGFSSERKETSWRCVSNCGACCKLDKGPAFATPEEIFQDPSDVQLYRSLIGPDGWCIHYEKSTRTCSIYPDRPYFCRVEPDVFEKLYGFDKKRFNKEACSCCTDTIKAIYGAHSKELENFNRAIKSTSCG